MSDLSSFFAQNVQAEVTAEVVVSDRFKDKDGKIIPWKLRSLTEEENELIRKQATKKVKGKGGVQTPETDMVDYLAKMAVACVVYPELKNAELQASYKVMGADALLRKMLLAGEYSELVQQVQKINGFDKDINELVEEVKN